jgi:holo-[acyl-carrier protein] synthase
MTVLGIGIDIIKINRIKNVYNRFGNRFLERVFNLEEINSFRSKLERNPEIAVGFLAGRC